MVKGNDLIEKNCKQGKPVEGGGRYPASRLVCVSIAANHHQRPANRIQLARSSAFSPDPRPQATDLLWAPAAVGLKANKVCNYISWRAANAPHDPLWHNSPTASSW